MTWSDDQIDKLKKRDPSAFEALYLEFKDRIYSFLFVKSGYNSDIASDLLQNTFASAMNSAPTLKHGTNIAGWIFTIASRRFTDHLRDKYRKNSDLSINDHDPVSKENTEKECIEQEKIAALHSALNNLKGKYREIIVMKYFKEMSDKEIAIKTGKGVKAVESLLYRSRQALKHEMIKTGRDLFGGEI